MHSAVRVLDDDLRIPASRGTPASGSPRCEVGLALVPTPVRRFYTSAFQTGRRTATAAVWTEDILPDPSGTEPVPSASATRERVEDAPGSDQRAALADLELDPRDDHCGHPLGVEGSHSRLVLDIKREPPLAIPLDRLLRFAEVEHAVVLNNPPAIGVEHDLRPIARVDRHGRPPWAADRNRIITRAAGRSGLIIAADAEPATNSRRDSRDPC